MKAAIISKPNKLEIVDDLPMPEIADYQILAEQLACGICTGTDTKLLHGKMKDYNSYPAVLGHESVGRVIKLGPKVRNYQLGDLVLRTGLGPISVDPSMSYCYGAFAQYGVAGDAKAMQEDGKTTPADFYTEKYLSQQVIPADMSPVDGTMLITFKEVLSALYRFGLGKGIGKVLIFGMGPVGLSMVRMAKLLNMQHVVACDIQDEKVELAKKFGADDAFNSQTTSAAQWAKHNNKRFDYIIDAVGVKELINISLPLLKYNGSMCVYGISTETKHLINWTDAPYNWNLKFVQWPTMGEESACHQQILAWIKDGKLIPGNFYSHVLALEDIEIGFNMLWTKKALKVIIDFTI